MQLELVPMLQTQRDLYDIPRGPERFRQYIATMTGESDDIALPLPAMNPMGKEHVAAHYDALLSMGAEAIAAEAMTEAARRLAHVESHFRLGLLVSDDLQGGWTNRYFAEFGLCFASGAMLKRRWIITSFWTSEVPMPALVRQEVLSSIFRAAYVMSNGAPKTLRAMLKQESGVARFSALDPPALPEEELAYLREVIQPHLEASDYPTIFACLYGDEAADSLGYPTLGLPHRAGLALAALGELLD